MIKITIKPITDKAKETLPQVMEWICPYEMTDENITTMVDRHGFHSAEQRAWQIAFLLQRFTGDELVSGKDYLFIKEQADDR